MHRAPSKRTEALSALVEDLRRPNPSYALGRPRPLLERNPVAFWRGAALVLAASNLVLIYLLTRRRGAPGSDRPIGARVRLTLPIELRFAGAEFDSGDVRRSREY